MSNLYKDFEKRFAAQWFSLNWANLDEEQDVQEEVNSSRKGLITLQLELEELNERIENLTQKQLRLTNLSKMYDHSEF